MDLLQLGADVEEIAAAAAVAAERALNRATDDPAFVQTLWLLTQLPLAARGPAFAADLQALGLSVADRPGLMDVAAAFTDAVDRHSRGQDGRTDLGEMAQMAAVESIVGLVGQSLPSLFSPTPEEVQREIGRYASGDRFSLLAREFFARLTQRRFDYYLSRELANHIGSGARFDDDDERSAFDAALGRHCREASRIVEAFAGGWYGKHAYQQDGLQRSDIPDFAEYALKKMGAELRKRRDAGARAFRPLRWPRAASAALARVKSAWPGQERNAKDRRHRQTSRGEHPARAARPPEHRCIRLRCRQRPRSGRKDR